MYARSPHAYAVEIPSGGTTIAIDGDLQDLLGVVNARAGTARGGFKAEAPDVAVGLAGAGGCGPYVNGFDLDGVFALFDYRNPDGSLRTTDDGRPDVTLYVAWRVQGQIGDVDGDGDPERATATRADCFRVLPGRRASAQVDEYYEVTLDLSCTGDFVDPARTLTFGVVATPGEPGGRLVAHPRTAAQAAVTGAFAYRNGAALGDAARGHALEARIDHVQDYLPAGTDLGHVTLAFAAGATGDGMADDVVRPGFVFAPEQEISVTRSPELHAGCPGTAVDWTITLRNGGLGAVRDLSVIDVLDPGLMYGGDDHGSVGDASTRTWSFEGGTLEPGASLTIRMNGVLAASCAEPLADQVSVRAEPTCGSGASLPDPAGIGDGPRALPVAFALHANAPNPFLRATTFRFALPERSHVTLTVYSIAGQRVAVVADGAFEPGVQSIEWRAAGRGGKPLAAGVYFYRFEAVGASSGRRFERSSQLVIRR